jgi:hypothetical protein
MPFLPKLPFSLVDNAHGSDSNPPLQSRINKYDRYSTRVAPGPMSLSALSSGNSSALLRRRPLRTGHESRPSSGSSRSTAPWSGTGQLINVHRGSTSGKVRRPRRVKGISQATYFDMPNDWNRRRAKKPPSLDNTSDFGLRSKYPVLVPHCVEVSLSYPACAFIGMPAQGPCP